MKTLDATTFGRVDGIWSSFVAAYFADLPAFVMRLRELLVDDGWVALVEIDDLLGHEPRSPALAADIARFYAWARANAGYGFLHGHSLAPALRDAGFELREHRCVLRVDNHFTFFESMLGAVDRGMELRGARMTARVSWRSPTSADFELSWTSLRASA